jgi:hypothetical protein
MNDVLYELIVPKNLVSIYTKKYNSAKYILYKEGFYGSELFNYLITRGYTNSIFINNYIYNYKRPNKKFNYLNYKLGKYSWRHYINLFI